ncbi:quinone oxidoreductase family protein [Tomitella biformata]|uniref:quinone oxidoreductase family protein n=1 Tax=Tomitella biformata TaxID=630403 RepID=UPI00046540BB|nr:quinone oxidoreductase [Tomitella biformata]
MRVIEVRQYGGPEVLQLRQRTAPRPGPGELLVELDAIGVNFIDTYLRSGAYPSALPFVPGSEGSGTVTAVGEGVDGFRPGARVAFANGAGAYAEQALVSASSAITVPPGVDAAVAASALLQGMTAHYLITSTYAAQAGDTILVHAGAGGVGLLLTQLATARGVRVLTTVSSEEKAALSAAAGAAEVLRYGPDLVARVRELTGGAGVAAVYDGVGAATFDQSLECVRMRGTLALFGAASGPVPAVDPQRLNAAGSIFLTRPTLAHHIANRAELEWRAGEILQSIAAGALHVRVGAAYPLEQASQAHIDLEGRRTTGSIVLVPR